MLGATLGNDVNLRDIEGRSALLLGKAKDNNASCAIGPFIRLFDARFTIDDVRSAGRRCEVRGEDGYRFEGRARCRRSAAIRWIWSSQTIEPASVSRTASCCSWERCSRPPRIAMRRPGFTHKIGDVVRVSSPALGVLENKVTTSRSGAAMAIGIGRLMRNLARRGLLRRSAA